MTRQDAQRRRPVSAPNPSRSIPARCSKVNTLRAPLDVPDRVPVALVHNNVGQGVEGPKSDRPVLRSAEEVSRTIGWSFERIEREGVDRSRVTDQLDGR